MRIVKGIINLTEEQLDRFRTDPKFIFGVVTGIYNQKKHPEYARKYFKVMTGHDINGNFDGYDIFEDPRGVERRRD